MYTCKIDNNSTSSQSGGSDYQPTSEDLHILQLQAAALVPEDATILADCDEVCALDDELAAALFTAKSYAVHRGPDTDSEDEEWPVEKLWREEENIEYDIENTNTFDGGKKSATFASTGLLLVSVAMAFLGGMNS